VALPGCDNSSEGWAWGVWGQGGASRLCVIGTSGSLVVGLYDLEVVYLHREEVGGGVIRPERLDWGILSHLGGWR
jgi:hypothetical protein